jgi:two-component sensor histidine kinase
MKRYLPILWVMLAVLILVMDFEAGADVILTVLLFFPVALAAWFNGRWWGVGLAIAAPAARLGIDLTGPHPLGLGSALVNEGLAIATFSGLALLIDLVVRQRAELQESIEEKNLALKEVHHRVKNNLQVVSSLLSLEGGKIDNPAAALVFKECRDRIHLMARLHQRLCAKEKFASVNLSDHLGEMAETLVNAHSPAGCRVDFQTPKNAMVVDIDTAMTLGLIANEVILNSLKHAFNGRDAGRMKIELVEGAQREMVVTDDGAGLPEDFGQKKKGSLGLELIHGLSRQIHGEARFAKGEGGGTRATISFPSPATSTEPANHESIGFKS